MKNSILIDSHIWPCISYVATLLRAEKVTIDQGIHYYKRSYINRYTILGPNGPETLTVPLRKGKSQECPLSKLMIAYDEPWPRRHLHALSSYYNSSPYYEHYKHRLESIFYQDYLYLIDFHKDMWNWLFSDFLGTGLESFSYSHEYIETCPSDTADLRGKYTPRNYDQATLPKKYSQVFEDKGGFVGNLSILDLIFNLGPQSSTYLQSLKI